jgi:hypothetical protein
MAGFSMTGYILVQMVPKFAALTGARRRNQPSISIAHFIPPLPFTRFMGAKLEPNLNSCQMLSGMFRFHLTA